MNAIANRIKQAYVWRAARFKLILNDKFSGVKDVKIIYDDYREFKKTGLTPHRSTRAIRRLFTSSNAKSHTVISKLISKPAYKYKNYPGIFEDLTQQQTDAFLKAMNTDGYYVFDQKLPADTVNKLFDFARETPALVLKAGEDGVVRYSEVKEIVNFEHPISPRYQFYNNDIIHFEPIQDLIFDESILNLSQLYLKSIPYFDVLAFWWSFPSEEWGKSKAAQMFHFDLDKIKFIKFFFYLTDVDPETGPHCYVKNTHRGGVPKSILRDGRQEDAAIEQIMGKDRIVEICGKKGSIIAVDTRGLHKGKSLTKDKRLLFQIMFSNSLFGANYADFDITKVDIEKRKTIEKYKETYIKFKNPSEALYDESVF